MAGVHWSWSRDQRDWVWLILNRADKKVNAIDIDVLLELEDALREIEQETQVKKVIITSAKASGFIAGADIETFPQLAEAGTAANFIQHGMDLFHRLSQYKYPTIALIHGFCLGGGFELALACDYRVVIDDPKTKLGLPEVKLGLQPGWGGSVRSMQLSHPMAVFEWMLTGKTLDAKKSKKLGLIDMVVPRRTIMGALGSLEGKPSRKISLISRLQNLPIVRQVLGSMMRSKVALKVKKEHYPAPFAMIDGWVKYGHLSQEAFKNEVNSINYLLHTSTAQNLVKVFFIQEHLKKVELEDSESIEHLHVIGAGLMGGDIAAWAALKGCRVTLQDINPQIIASALVRAQELGKRQLKDPVRIQAFLDRLIPDLNGNGIAKADCILEAVNEQISLKRSILKDVALKAKKEAVICTNTSTIPLEQIMDIFENTSRFVGMHFFNPVGLMPLVEIVIGEKTSQHAASRIHKFVKRIEKTPVFVKSSPGFLVNRILLPYMVEAMLLYQEGISIEAIDAIACDFGMPMGPIELADTVGLDVCLAAISSLGTTHEGLIDFLKQKITIGALGKKAGQGFYAYKDKKPVKAKIIQEAHPEAQLRLVMCLCQEAVKCWREQVVKSLDELNAASIFGFGFPPFEGGIIEYIKSQGIPSLKEKCELLEKRYGQRFTPDLGWDKLSMDFKDEQEKCLVEGSTKGSSEL